MIANASPSWQRAMRIVRSFSGSLTAADHIMKSRSICRFNSSYSVNICKRGPVPMVSFASVNTIPLAYELLEISQRARLRRVCRTLGEASASALKHSAAAQ
eukprot:TRINITY_DN34778_c0_g1_i1.p2 TRINITY_DN34778_c0_g1~~TRINITY_DN34778_c0_g1_i1.p2  ORF type:complete len:101 (-),score=9.68 TRINITY_DN34778_c0_g1_i1:221-523(-)